MVEQHTLDYKHIDVENYKDLSESLLKVEISKNNNSVSSEKEVKETKSIRNDEYINAFRKYFSIDGYSDNEQLAQALSDSIQDKLSNLLPQHPESENIKQSLKLKGIERISYLFNETQDPNLQDLAFKIKTEFGSRKSDTSIIEFLDKYPIIAEYIRSKIEENRNTEESQQTEVSIENINIRTDVERNRDHIILKFSSLLNYLKNDSFVFRNNAFKINPEWSNEIDQEKSKKFGFIKSTLHIYGYENIKNDSDLSEVLKRIPKDREKLTQGLFAKFRNRKKIEKLDRLLSTKNDMFLEYYNLKNKEKLLLERLNNLNTIYNQLPDDLKQRLSNIDSPTIEIIIQSLYQT